MKKPVILFPNFEELKTAVEKLRTELSALVFEHDELLYVECKNLEMAYMLALGGFEYKAYELECAVLRLKRKIELIQAKKNRQEKVIPAEIEALLDAEFARYQARLNEQLERMNAALERNRLRRLTGEETRELKKLYRAIVKQLHPDINPDSGEAEIRLFHNAVAAYKNGDIDGLRMISMIVTGTIIPGEKADPAPRLVKEKERLSKLLLSVKEDIAKTKAEYPYTMKTLLQSPAEIEERRAQLESRIEQLRESLAAYRAKIGK